MPPETLFEFLERKINSDEPFVAKYTAGAGGGMRKFWPHVLGWSLGATGALTETILCYQYHPPSGVGWKCMKLVFLQNWGDVPGTPPPADAELTIEQIKRQNCVQIVKASR